MGKERDKEVERYRERRSIEILTDNFITDTCQSVQ